MGQNWKEDKMTHTYIANENTRINEWLSFIEGNEYKVSRLFLCGEYVPEVYVVDGLFQWNNGDIEFLRRVYKIDKLKKHFHAQRETNTADLPDSK